MKHPLLILADKERLKDELGRSLNPAKVSAGKAKGKPHKLADGGGLFLLVMPKERAKARKFWRYKYRIQGREGLFALGTFPEIGLADARRIHLAARWLVERGIPPAQYVKEERARYEVERQAKETNTFRHVCEQWLARDVEKLAPSTKTQRKRELDKDVLPPLGGREIGSIRKDELTSLLHKIQGRAPEVARNVRQYLAGIFDYAIDAGLVSGSPVPGRKVLAPRSQKPHPALPLARVGKLIEAVEASGCNPQTRIAARLLMLTAVRKSELINAKWDEFDLDKSEWNIPAGRTKMRKPHWVPLSHQAVELLRELRTFSTGELLFPNIRNPRKPMATRSLNALLGRLGFLAEAKPHGFRAMFSTYCNGAGWNPDVIEKCLGHNPKDTIRAKYNRHEYRDEQRKLVQHWANTLEAISTGAKVLPIGQHRYG